MTPLCCPPKVRFWTKSRAFSLWSRHSSSLLASSLAFDRYDLAQCTEAVALPRDIELL